MIPKVIEAAKQANGRSRMCTKCPMRNQFGICTADAIKVCSKAFVEGFEKGVKWYIKNLKKQNNYGENKNNHSNRNGNTKRI